MAEQALPGDGLQLGEAVVVVRPTPVPAMQWRGTCELLKGDLARLAMEVDLDQPLSLQRDEGVILVRFTPNGRYAGRGEFLGLAVEGAWFRAARTSWRLLEERQSPRVATHIACEVRGATIDVRQPGVILDLSEGGARIGVPRHIGETRLEVHLVDGDDAVLLPAAMLAAEQKWEQVELRVRFERLSTEQLMIVRGIVARWAKDRRPA